MTEPQQHTHEHHTPDATPPVVVHANGTHSLTYKWLVGVLLGIIIPALAWIGLDTRAIVQGNAKIVARQQVLMEWTTANVAENKLSITEQRARTEKLQRQLDILDGKVNRK